MRGFIYRAIFIISLSFCVLQSTPDLFAFVSVDSKELRALAAEFAPKVNIFSAVWAVDKNAIFYGGTTRDYLYWIRDRLKGARTRSELESKIQAIRDLPFIDIKGIIGPESDVDVISLKESLVDADDFAIKKLDIIEPDRLDPQTEMGKNEVDQGFIAAEKIELSIKGIRTQERFGDGVKDIVTGNLTMNPTKGDRFWNSHFAKGHLNHPLLLVIRYLRLRGLHWAKTHGDERPKLGELLDFDPKLKAYIKQVFAETLAEVRSGKPSKFLTFLRTKKGKRWFNGAVLKAFRSYTNPTAMFMLMEAFGYKELQAEIPELMEPINQFLFIQDRKPDLIAANFEKYKVKPKDVLIRFGDLVKEAKIFHGTPEEEAFRAILFQNVLPSKSDRAAGSGLYGVERKDIAEAVEIAGSKHLVVEFDVAEDAKVIDITQGPGLKLFKDSGMDHDTFADAFGADILRYTYKTEEGGKIPAYVVKNSAVFIGRRGHTRNLMTTLEALNLAEKVSSPAEYYAFLRTLDLNAFTSDEKSVLKDRALEAYALPFSIWLKTASVRDKSKALRENGFSVSDLPIDLFNPETLDQFLEVLASRPEFLQKGNKFRQQVDFLLVVLDQKPLVNKLDTVQRLLRKFDQAGVTGEKSAAELLSALLFRSGLTEEERESLGDLLVTEGLNHSEWLLALALYPIGSNRFSEATRDRWVENQLSRSEDEESDRRLLSIFEEGFSNFGQHVGDFSLPVSKMPYSLYEKMGGWIETLLLRGRVTDRLFSTALLQSKMKDSAEGPVWSKQPRFQKWIKYLLSRVKTLDDLEEHIHPLLTFGLGYGFINEKSADSTTLKTLESLLKKPRSDYYVGELFDDIVRRNLISRSAMKFLFSNYDNSMGVEGFLGLIKYMEKNEPQNSRYHQIFLKELEKEDVVPEWVAQLFRIANWDVKDLQQQRAVGRLIQKGWYTRVPQMTHFVSFFRRNGFATPELQKAALELFKQLVAPEGGRLDGYEALALDLVSLILNSDAIGKSSPLFLRISKMRPDLASAVTAGDRKLADKFGAEVQPTPYDQLLGILEEVKTDPPLMAQCLAAVRRLTSSAPSKPRRVAK